MSVALFIVPRVAVTAFISNTKNAKSYAIKQYVFHSKAPRVIDLPLTQTRQGTPRVHRDGGYRGGARWHRCKVGKWVDFPHSATVRANNRCAPYVYLMYTYESYYS